VKKRSLGILITSIVLGMLIGSVFGEIIAYIVPHGVVRDFFLQSISPKFGPGSIDLIVVQFTLGFEFKLNMVSVLGIFIAVYYFRWY